MDRRTDRAVAIAAAVTVVPMAILVVVKTGLASPDEEPDPPSSRPAAARIDPPVRASGAPDATPSPSDTASPVESADAAGDDRTRARARKEPKANGGGSAEPPRLPPNAPKLTSFVRITDVRLSGKPNGDHQHLRETATFTLAPEFALNATGVRKNVVDGDLSTITQKVIVKGGRMSGYDGRTWSHSTLTAAQLTSLRTGSDPRLLTVLVRSLPGAERSGPDASGSTRYVAEVPLRTLSALLPDDVAAAVGEVLPGSTGVSLDLWAGRNDRPSWIGLNASVPGTRLTGSMTFRSYR